MVYDWVYHINCRFVGFTIWLTDLSTKKWNLVDKTEEFDQQAREWNRQIWRLKHQKCKFYTRLYKMVSRRIIYSSLRDILQESHFGRYALSVDQSSDWWFESRLHCGPANITPMEIRELPKSIQEIKWYRKQKWTTNVNVTFLKKVRPQNEPQDIVYHSCCIPTFR